MNDQPIDPAGLATRARELARRLNADYGSALCCDVSDFLREVAAQQQRAAEPICARGCMPPKTLCAECLSDRKYYGGESAQPAVQAGWQLVGHLHSNGEFCQDRHIVPDEWPVPLFAAAPKGP